MLFSSSERERIFLSSELENFSALLCSALLSFSDSGSLGESLAVDAAAAAKAVNERIRVATETGDCFLFAAFLLSLLFSLFACD